MPLLVSAADPTRWFRRFLVGAAAAVYLGGAVELVLVGHVESWQQFIPFGVIALGLAAAGRWWARPDARADRALRAVAALAVLAAVAGVGFHLWGNYTLSREVDAGAGLWETVWASVAGGNPLLAPGMVALAGVLAAAATVRRTTPPA